MKKAVILHGLQSEEEYFNVEKPAPSNAHWLPWLQKQLNIRGILSQTPEMPAPYAPDYQSWAELFESFDINEETILVGHSLGAGFLLRWLCEHPQTRVNSVALVAPWLDTENRLQSHFFDFELNNAFVERCKAVTIFSSDNDMERINLTVDLCKKTLTNVTLVELEGRGHFLKKHMGTEEFPELVRCLADD